MSVEDNDLKPSHDNKHTNGENPNSKNSPNDANTRKQTQMVHKSPSFDAVDFGFTRQPVKPPQYVVSTNDEQLSHYDSVDVGLSRKPGSVSKAEKADCFDCVVAVISIFTFVGDVVTDILAAHQYFTKAQWSWFAPTVTLILLPSFVLQLFSSKWYHDDQETQSIFSYVIHFLQLSTIERYEIITFPWLKKNLRN